MKELLDSDRVNYLIWRFVFLRNAPRPVPRLAPTAQPSITALTRPPARSYSHSPTPSVSHSPSHSRCDLTSLTPYLASLLTMPAAPGIQVLARRKYVHHLACSAYQPSHHPPSPALRPLWPANQGIRVALQTFEKPPPSSRRNGALRLLTGTLTSRLLLRTTPSSPSSTKA